jgi:hypothetical protein
MEDGRTLGDRHDGRARLSALPRGRGDFRRRLFVKVAMRGGTVLHKGHLAPARRYSEDIDLVLVGDRPASHIKKALTRVLRPVLGTPAESFLTDVRLAVRNLAMKSKILRSTYTYDPYSQDATLAHLKIEVNLNENRKTESQVRAYPLSASVRSLLFQSRCVTEYAGGLRSGLSPDARRTSARRSGYSTSSISTRRTIFPMPIPLSRTGSDEGPTTSL